MATETRMFGQGVEVKELIDSLIQAGYPLAYLAMKCGVVNNTLYRYHKSPDLATEKVYKKLLKIQKDVESGTLPVPPRNWRVVEKERRRQATEKAREVLKQNRENRAREGEVVPTMEEKVMVALFENPSSAVVGFEEKMGEATTHYQSLIQTMEDAVEKADPILAPGLDIFLNGLRSIGWVFEKYGK